MASKESIENYNLLKKMKYCFRFVVNKFLSYIYPDELNNKCLGSNTPRVNSNILYCQINGFQKFFDKKKT